MKKVIIFGATGNTGAYLTEYCIENLNSQEFEVVAVGRKQTNFFDKKGIEYHRVDITEASQFDKLPHEDVHAVINLAAILPAYMRRAPFYRDTIEILKTAFNIETESIVQLNAHVLKTVCGYIGVGLNVDIFSEMHLSIVDVKAPDEWALNICKALGNVGEYWNPEGGLEFYDRSKYYKAGIDIKFLSMNIRKYPQGQPEFEARLSIVDIMMFNKPEKINEMLDDYMLL